MIVHRRHTMPPRILLGLACLITAAPIAPAMARGGYIGGSGSVAVRGYVTSRGTYVAPHVRTRPDGVLENNLSYRGGSRQAVGSPMINGEPGPLPSAGVPRSIPGPTTWTGTDAVPQRASCDPKRLVGTGAGFCLVN